MKKVYVVFPETVEFVPVSLEERSVVGDVDEAGKDLLLFLYQNVPARIARPMLELMGGSYDEFERVAEGITSLKDRKIRILQPTLGNSPGDEVRVMEESGTTVEFVDGLGRWCWFGKDEEGTAWEEVGEGCH